MVYREELSPVERALCFGIATVLVVLFWGPVIWLLSR